MFGLVRNPQVRKEWGGRGSALTANPSPVHYPTAQRNSSGGGSSGIPSLPNAFDITTVLMLAPFRFAAPSGGAMFNDYSICGTGASKIFRKRNEDLSSIPLCGKRWTINLRSSSVKRGVKSRMLCLPGSSESHPPACTDWKTASRASPSRRCSRSWTGCVARLGMFFCPAGETVPVCIVWRSLKALVQICDCFECATSDIFWD